MPHIMSSSVIFTFHSVPHSECNISKQRTSKQQMLRKISTESYLFKYIDVCSGVCVCKPSHHYMDPSKRLSAHSSIKGKPAQVKCSDQILCTRTNKLVLKYATNVYSFMYVRKYVCHDYSKAKRCDATRRVTERTSHS